jgi:hypothetical protein
VFFLDRSKQPSVAIGGKRKRTELLGTKSPVKVPFGVLALFRWDARILLPMTPRYTSAAMTLADMRSLGVRAVNVRRWANIERRRLWAAGGHGSPGARWATAVRRMWREANRWPDWSHYRAQEASWREDHRRMSNGEQVQRLAGLAMKKETSPDFTGYW